MNFTQLKKLIIHADTKIVMLIMDGLGGLPIEIGGKTELETANTPTMDALAEHSALGLSSPAGPGIAVGSGPGHLALHLRLHCQGCLFYLLCELHPKLRFLILVKVPFCRSM